MERKNIYIVILIITTIIAACFAIYLYINPSIKGEKIVNNNVSNVTSNVSDGITSNIENTSNDKEKIVYKYQRPNLDETKCINSNEDIVYTVKRNAISSDGICTATLNNSKEVSIAINWYGVQKEYNITKPDTVNDIITTETQTITNFNTNIVDIYICNLGQGVEPILFFLMEDGSVEYMHIIKALNEKEYKSHGKLNGVEDVVEIIEASTNRNGMCPVAIKQDGSFYDLSKLINK